MATAASPASSPTASVSGPVTIGPLTLAVEALKILEERRISSLVVIDDGRVVGVLHLHDLWRTELF